MVVAAGDGAASLAAAPGSPGDCVGDTASGGCWGRQRQQDPAFHRGGWPVGAPPPLASGGRVLGRRGSRGGTGRQSGVGAVAAGSNLRAGSGLRSRRAAASRRPDNSGDRRSRAALSCQERVILFNFSVCRCKLIPLTPAKLHLLITGLNLVVELMVSRHMSVSNKLSITHHTTI